MTKHEEPKAVLYDANPYDEKNDVFIDKKSLYGKLNFESPTLTGLSHLYRQHADTLYCAISTVIYRFKNSVIVLEKRFSREIEKNPDSPSSRHNPTGFFAYPTKASIFGEDSSVNDAVEFLKSRGYVHFEKSAKFQEPLLEAPH